ncbi:LLM class flavin-dependent oxidoreductase [Catellatospora tritici]|uniref:LLM class flavin-dependent oxidoreductase n=1 Tax=Catellatospora tritici TaxID=2851566 RepID=UPI0035567A0F
MSSWSRRLFRRCGRRRPACDLRRVGKRSGPGRVHHPRDLCTAVRARPCPVAEGASHTEALAHTTRLAQRTEQLGYRRFWVAEHHNMPGIASSARPCCWPTSRRTPVRSGWARAG